MLQSVAIRAQKLGFKRHHQHHCDEKGTQKLKIEELGSRHKKKWRRWVCHRSALFSLYHTIWAPLALKSRLHSHCNRVPRAAVSSRSCRLQTKLADCRDVEDNHTCIGPGRFEGAGHDEDITWRLFSRAARENAVRELPVDDGEQHKNGCVGPGRRSRATHCKAHAP